MDIQLDTKTVLKASRTPKIDSLVLTRTINWIVPGQMVEFSVPIAYLNSLIKKIEATASVQTDAQFVTPASGAPVKATY